ncbi:VOC family protein [Pseudonocardia sp. CA-107938]|uniref:VOC family protein n=1 Tax=Pseudonocardia sp. CA-107938 TaxID=3240021 RepID=UPI003D8A3E5A
MIELDHVALPARSSAVSARQLGDLLGGAPVTPEGPDGDMNAVHVGHRAMVLYMDSPAEIPRQHLALRVDRALFDGLVAQLTARRIPFGNDPSDQANGRTDDCIGTGRRVYFADPDGHLLEVVTEEA